MIKVSTLNIVGTKRFQRTIADPVNIAILLLLAILS